MPTVKNARKKQFRKKKRRTVKNSMENRVWMYRKGNVVVCSRSPIVRQIVSIIGGDSKGDSQTPIDEKAKFLIQQLRASSSKSDIKSFVTKYEDELVKKLSENPPLKTAEELKKASPNIKDNEEVKNELEEWTKNRMNAKFILRQVNEDTDNNLSEEEQNNIERILNHEKLGDIRGQLSSMSASAFGALSEIAVSLGEFFTPPRISDTSKLQNETTVQFLWYPRSNINYRKGRSKPDPKMKYGDFMINIMPEKYADTPTYLSEMANSVEDLLANALNGCSDSLCLKGKPVREPYKKQIMTIVNKQPQFDFEEQQKSTLEIAK